MSEYEQETEFAELVEAMQIPLPTAKSQVAKLREAVAFAESCGVILSQYLRVKRQQLDEEAANELESLKKLEVYQKSNADEKKLLLNNRLAVTRAKVEYAEGLEELIKRRCSLGQSFIKSIDLEERTTYNV